VTSLTRMQLQKAGSVCKIIAAIHSYE